jgi:hypothetical protein
VPGQKEAFAAAEFVTDHRLKVREQPIIEVDLESGPKLQLSHVTAPSGPA